MIRLDKIRVWTPDVYATKRISTAPIIDKEFAKLRFKYNGLVGWSFDCEED